MAFLRSIARILVAVAAFAGAFVIAIRQPTLPARDRLAVHANPATLRHDVVVLTSMPRCAGDAAALDRASAYIAARFAESGAGVGVQRYTVRGRVYSNIVANFDGRGEPLVVGAHYDAFCEPRPLPGADDNASGVAGLLELARILGRVPHRPVILVAYANEEPPFFGSDEMGSAVHARSAAGHVRGMIALEMIGCFTARQPWPSRLLAMLYPRTGDFVALAGRWHDLRLLREMKRGMSASLPVAAAVLPTGSGIEASDHISYWRAGVPAIIVTDTAYLRNPRYHTARDSAETLDYAAMARVVDGVANAVR